MTTSKSRLAYQTHYEIFEKALEDGRGVRIPFPEYGPAWNFRINMNHARALDREENAKTYEPGHKLYGRSVYDPFRVTVENIDGKFYIYVMKVNIEDLQIEGLSTLETPVEEADVEP